jgi:two-component system, OmpR family, KDP operon response regulator KdpE
VLGKAGSADRKDQVKMERHIAATATIEAMTDLHVLLVEDDDGIARPLTAALTGDGYEVVRVATGREALARAAEGVRVVLLDLGLPDIDGVEVCRRLREVAPGVPVLMLTARTSETDVVVGLDAGADDYVTKPFSTVEFQARVRAQLRRERLAAHPSGIELGHLHIHLANRTVTRGGEVVHLTPTEWDLLRAFVKHAGRTLTHQQIFREVWGKAAGDAQAYLRVHIANLRRKIEEDPVRPQLILTEPGVGYRFTAAP